MKLSAIVLAVVAISSGAAMACPGKSNVQASGSDRQQSTATIEGITASGATVVK